MKAKGRLVPDRDYEVGYGKPPVQNRFKKGQPSPNPKGRPRNSKAVELPSILNEFVSIKMGGRIRKVPYLAAYLHVLKDRAIKGDLKSGQLIIMMAKHFKMLDVPPIEDDLVVTLRIGEDPPPAIRRRMEENKRRGWDGEPTDGED
jgi:Family of unknown function (DUF5681)